MARTLTERERRLLRDVIAHVRHSIRVAERHLATDEIVALDHIVGLGRELRADGRKLRAMLRGRDKMPTWKPSPKRSSR
jgi:hypothetical protein